MYYKTDLQISDILYLRDTKYKFVFIGNGRLLCKERFTELYHFNPLLQHHYNKQFDVVKIYRPNSEYKITYSDSSTRLFNPNISFEESLSHSILIKSHFIPLNELYKI